MKHAYLLRLIVFVCCAIKCNKILAAVFRIFNGLCILLLYFIFTKDTINVLVLCTNLVRSLYSRDLFYRLCSFGYREDFTLRHIFSFILQGLLCLISFCCISCLPARSLFTRSFLMYLHNCFLNIWKCIGIYCVTFTLNSKHSRAV